MSRMAPDIARPKALPATSREGGAPPWIRLGPIVGPVAGRRSPDEKPSHPLLKFADARHQSLSQRPRRGRRRPCEARRRARHGALRRARAASARSLQTRTQDLQARRNALSKQIGAAKGKGEDASALLAEVAGIGDETRRPRRRARARAGRAARFPARPAEPHACERARRQVVGRQRRGAALGHAAPLRLPGARPHRHRREPRPARLRDRRQAVGRALHVPAGRSRAAAPRARAVHARHADARARLHRVLHALHRQRRDAGRHDPAAEVRSRHVLGARRAASTRTMRRRAALPHLHLRDHADQLRARRDPSGRGAAA